MRPPRPAPRTVTVVSPPDSSTHGAALDLLDAARDQVLDLARGGGAALGQRAHLAGDDREAAAFLARAQALGLHARERLDDNDTHAFFEALGDSVVTGPTRTNVNDFRALLIA